MDGYLIRSLSSVDTVTWYRGSGQLAIAPHFFYHTDLRAWGFFGQTGEDEIDSGLRCTLRDPARYEIWILKTNYSSMCSLPSSDSYHCRYLVNWLRLPNILIDLLGSLPTYRAYY